MGDTDDEVASLKKMVETLSAANARLTALYLGALALTANCRNDKCRAVAALATERAKTAEYDEIERLVVAMRAGKVESVAVA